MSEWKKECARYQDRLDGLGAPLLSLRDDVRMVPPAPLPYRPTAIGLIKYQLCLLVMGGVRSATELVQSTQLLWGAGRFLGASLNIRLLMEIWGALAFSEAKVLQILDESGDLSAVSPTIEKLLFGFESGTPLSSQSVVSVTEFMRAADVTIPGAAHTYRFLCDTSHPTFLSYTYLLLAGANYDYWRDKKFTREAHQVLNRTLEGAEMAVAGIEMVAYAIFRNALPVVLAEAKRPAVRRTEPMAG